jgi:hypothetical protein
MPEKINMADYLQKKKIMEKTSIWEHYLRETAGEFGKCKIWHKILKTAG